MAIDDKIKYEKLQYNVNREAAYRQVKLININILQMKRY